MSINKVAISGNLTRDPELKQAGQSTVLEMGVAVNERRKNSQTDQWEEVPSFIDVNVWGARGEALSRFLRKGMKIAVTGRLRQDRWQAQDGTNRSKIIVIADEVDFMSSPREDGGNYSQGDGGQQYSASASAPAGPSVEVLTEDIPF
ncbi:MAG: single-stranded DNA-binding protein [Actinomycetes bacterium]|jgi:single-strand DNA-binding protein|nr:single-stranded DNA-binding protein [Actinomycetes bacterium]